MIVNGEAPPQAQTSEGAPVAAGGDQPVSLEAQLQLAETQVANRASRQADDPYASSSLFSQPTISRKSRKINEPQPTGLFDDPEPQAATKPKVDLVAMMNQGAYNPVENPLFGAGAVMEADEGNDDDDDLLTELSKKPEDQKNPIDRVEA